MNKGDDIVNILKHEYDKMYDGIYRAHKEKREINYSALTNAIKYASMATDEKCSISMQKVHDKFYNYIIVFRYDNIIIGFIALNYDDKTRRVMYVEKHLEGEDI